MWLCLFVAAVLSAACEPDRVASFEQSPLAQQAPDSEDPAVPDPPEELMALEGSAGSPSGPGVEPPSTPTPEPPDDASEAPTNSGAGAAGGNAEPAAPAPVDDPNDLQSEPACILATRLDTCCLEPVAASPQEVQSDDCLVPYDHDHSYPVEQQSVCQAPLELCALVRCAAPTPPSLVVALDAAGNCSFVDECQADSDCVIAADHDSMCACAAVWPRSVADAEMCVVEAGMQVPPQCPPAGGADCSCPQATQPQCLSQDGLRVCR